MISSKNNNTEHSLFVQFYTAASQALRNEQQSTIKHN